MRARDEAKKFIRAQLADGPKPSTEALKAAAVAGFSASTIKRAKLALGIVSTKDAGADGQWRWRLPPQGAQHHQEVQEVQIQEPGGADSRPLSFAKVHAGHSAPRVSTNVNMQPDLPREDGASRLIGNDRVAGGGPQFFVYAPGPEDPEETVAFGKAMKKGEPVEFTDPHAIRKLRGNRFFKWLKAGAHTMTTAEEEAR